MIPLDQLRLAVLNAPEDPAALRALAAGLLAAGKPGEAAGAVMSALERAPGDGASLALLSDIAQAVAAGSGVALPIPGARAVLAVLAAEKFEHQLFFHPALSHLRQSLAPLWRQSPEAAAQWLLAEPKAHKDAVLHAFLARMVNIDPHLELVLTEVRRRILLERRHRALPAGFLVALARQAIANEFVWFETPEEQAAMAQLAEDLAKGAAAGRKLAGGEVLAHGLYRPSTSIARLRRATIADPAARALVAEMFCEAEEEARLLESIPVLAGPAGSVSAAVARQYEENPYPRWLGLTPPRAGAAPHPKAQAGEPMDVLVAGCGTGKQAIRAALLYGPRARVTAIDLSRRSLAYAARMAKRHGIANVTFAQADILALDGLDRRFDVVECTGVLHHMEDPMAGWRVLASLLGDGGMMYVALYSQAARRLVTEARNRIAALGLGDDADSIRAFRRDILLGREKLGGLVSGTSDFFSTSGARDLMFHVQEHQFTIPRLRQSLDALGLEFAGFHLPGARVADPLDLAQWEAAEAARPDLFRQMYQFWCRLA